MLNPQLERSHDNHFISTASKAKGSDPDLLTGFVGSCWQSVGQITHNEEPATRADEVKQDLSSQYIARLLITSRISGSEAILVVGRLLHGGQWRRGLR